MSLLHSLKTALTELITLTMTTEYQSAILSQRLKPYATLPPAFLLPPPPPIRHSLHPPTALSSSEQNIRWRQRRLKSSTAL